jgi:hypothetical protein
LNRGGFAVLDFHRRGQSPVYHTAGPPRRRVFYAVAAVGLVYLVGFKLLPFLMSPLVDPNAAPQIDTLKPKSRAADALPGQFIAMADAADQRERPPPAERFAGVRDDLLRSVRDDDLFRAREHDAFFHLLQVLDRADESALQAGSRGRIAFAQLYQQSKQYRGELVTLRGGLRMLELQRAPRNEYGIGHYYRAVIQPDDNPTYPIIVYLLELPAGFPTQLVDPGQPGGAEEHREEVQLTGFFYRRLAYEARDDVRIAPLVLAKTFTWIAPDPNLQAQKTSNISVLATAIVVGLILLVLVATRGGRRWSANSSGRGAQAEALRGLAQVEQAPTPQESLNSLAAAMEAAEIDDSTRDPGAHSDIAADRAGNGS